MRSGELFTPTDDRVDLDGAAVFVPAELCKVGVDKRIPLPEEVDLLREQLGGLRVVDPSSPTAHLPSEGARDAARLPEGRGSQ